MFMIEIMTKDNEYEIKKMTCYNEVYYDSSYGEYHGYSDSG